MVSTIFSVRVSVRLRVMDRVRFFIVRVRVGVGPGLALWLRLEFLS